MAKKVINIENYFSEKNEQDGVWHEPIIDGNPIGIELLVMGIHSDFATNEMIRIGLESANVEKSDLSKDEKNKKLEELDAERVAVLTKGIRAVDGSTLTYKGEKIKFTTELMKELYLNSPDIKMEIANFVVKSSNFIIFD